MDVCRLICIGLMGALACPIAIAQPVPTTVAPGAIERELRPLPEARVTHPVPGVREAEPRVTSAPPGAEETVFTLRTISLEGNTVVSTAELLDPHRSEYGRDVSVERIYEIAAEMTAVYRSRGYILSAVVVPAQEIADGEVRLVVVEGFLSEVRFEGYTGNRDGMFSKIRASLLAERPLRLRSLERTILLLNDLPGIVAQGVLHRSATEDGGSELVVRLARQAVGFEAGVNNRGSEVQGPTRYATTLSLNSVFGALEGTQLTYLAASTSSQLKYGAASQSYRLSAAGTSLRIFASKSKSTPDLGVDFQDFNLETDTEEAGIELVHPLVRSRTRNVSLAGLLTYHDGVTDSAFEPNLTQDTISAVRVGLTFDAIDEFRGVNLLDIRYHHGIDAFGASDKSDPNLSRSGGRPDFSKATLYLARLQSLGGGFSVLVAASGQYAFSNLLSPEEFAYGGEPFGRAYDGSELVGDSGAAGKLELRYTIDRFGRGGMTFYTFLDAGRVWRRLGPDDVDLDSQEDATAYGGGLRFSLGRWLTGYGEIAVPNKIVAAEGNDDTRYFFGLRTVFGSAQY